MAWAWPKIRRGITSGMPQWYKEILLKKQFEVETPVSAPCPPSGVQ